MTKSIAAMLLAFILTTNSPATGSPLHKAALEGDLQEIEQLLTSGAVPDAPLKERGNFTPLHFASGKGHTEIVRALLKKGANPNLRNAFHRTPLHYAAMYGHEEIVLLLITHGAQVNAMDLEGHTPLDHARHESHDVALSHLLLTGGKSGLEKIKNNLYSISNQGKGFGIFNVDETDLGQCIYQLEGGYYFFMENIKAGQHLLIKISAFKNEEGTSLTLAQAQKKDWAILTCEKPEPGRANFTLGAQDNNADSNN